MKKVFKFLVGVLFLALSAAFALVGPVYYTPLGATVIEFIKVLPVMEFIGIGLFTSLAGVAAGLFLSIGFAILISFVKKGSGKKPKNPPRVETGLKKKTPTPEVEQDKRIKF